MMVSDMSHGPLGHDIIPRNWEFVLRKTPEEWWVDYHWKHPEYDPYTLDDESWARIYGWGRPDDRLAVAISISQHRRQESYEEFKFRRRVTGVDEDVDDDPGTEFLNSYFGDDFKYVLVLSRISRGVTNTSKPSKEDRRKAISILGKAISEGLADDETDLQLAAISPAMAIEVQDRRGRYYSPMLEAPKVYRKFCRLSCLTDLGWSPQKVMAEVLKFVNRYGPPWYNELADLYSPPYDLYRGPLTIDRVLWHSRAMNSTAQVYRLLADTAVDVTAKTRLRQLLADLQRKNRSYHEHARVIIRNGIAGKLEYNDDTFQLLRTDEDVTKAAVAYVMSQVNVALARSGVTPELSANLRQKPAAAWICQYTYVDLLGAMWLQIYSDIIQNTRVKGM